VTTEAIEAQAWRAFVEAYEWDIEGFAENVLNFVPLPDQRRAMRAVQAALKGDGPRRISIRAGHGVGKSATCAIVMLWFMVTRFPQKTVCTAPTAGQLFDALFAEVKLWHGRLPGPVKDLFEVFSDRIVLRAAPESSFMSARTSSADRPEAMAGIHSEHVLLVFDEASGIPEPVFESAAGSMSGHSAVTIMISNPTRSSGLFFKSHHQLRSEWATFHMSCLDNPLVSQDFVDQIRTTYGENSNAYRVRVLGEFPLTDDDTLIPAEWVDAAMSRDVALSTREPIVYGLDVARFGDDRTVLCKRQGQVVLEFKAWNGADLMETVGRVVNEAKLDKPSEILVDSIGLGAGVADRLREMGFNVRDVNVAETSALDQTAYRLRDELWLAVKEWLGQRVGRLPKDEDLRQELVAPTFTFTSTGRVKVEGKAEMKRRGYRSPDKADALCLTFAGQGAMVGGRAPRWVTGQPLKRKLRGIV
jgi:phage terminase large subunit